MFVCLCISDINLEKIIEMSEWKLPEIRLIKSQVLILEAQLKLSWAVILFQLSETWDWFTLGQTEDSTALITSFACLNQQGFLKFMLQLARVLITCVIPLMVFVTGNNYLFKKNNCKYISFHSCLLDFSVMLRNSYYQVDMSQVEVYESSWKNNEIFI